MFQKGIYFLHNILWFSGRSLIWTQAFKINKSIISPKNQEENGS